MKKMFSKCSAVVFAGVVFAFLGLPAWAFEDCGSNFQATFSYEGATSPSETGIPVPIGSDFLTKLSLVALGEDESEAGESVDIVMVMDRSGSMGWVADGMVKMEQAQNALEQVVSLFKNEDNPRHRLALVSYNSSVTLDQPLTSNYEKVDVAIKSLSAGGSTNIGGALSVAANHLKNTGNPDSKKIILIATDGMHNTGTPVASGIAKVPEYASVYSVGIGDSSYYDEDVLKAIAGAGDGEGKYYSSSVAELVQTFELIIQDILKPFRPENVQVKFFQKNEDKFDLLETDPNYSGFGSGQVEWNDLGKMVNGDSKIFDLKFLQSGGYGLGLELNESYVEATYELFGKSCYEKVAIPVLKIDNLPKCTGSIPMNGQICLGDNTGLSADSPNILVESCSFSIKCEYFCPAPLKYRNGACVVDGACGNLEGEQWCRSLPSGFDYCSSGFLSDGPNEAGNRWNWTCGGIFGGDAVSCNAGRICPHDWKEANP